MGDLMKYGDNTKKLLVDERLELPSQNAATVHASGSGLYRVYIGSPGKLLPDNKAGNSSF
jgi:hypothetical protein